MNLRFFLEHWYAMLLGAMLCAIVVAGGFVLIVALPDIQRTGASGGAGPSPSASPLATPGTMAWVVIPADADCAACHQTENGAIGLKPVPKIAHPLDGWSDCTACHAKDRLVQTAPGHSGIHATECLTCHQTGDLPQPLSRPHRALQNTDCLSCHGKTAPLPNTMAHRTQTVCWLCHRLPSEQPPVPPHPVKVGQTDCLRCHGAGLAAGALPADHEKRTASECLLCHAPPSSSPVPQ